MAKIERNETCFEFNESQGTYSFYSGVFALENLAPALYLNDKKSAFGRWKVTKLKKNAMTAVAAGKNGEWTLKAGINAAGALTLSLNGKLQAAVENVQVWYFDELNMPADHVAVQSGTMGGCHLIPLNTKTPCAPDFDGAIQMLVTKKKVQLALSFPLIGEHMETFSGKTAKGKVQSFRAGFNIKHTAAKQIKLKPLTLRAGDGFAMMHTYADENVTEKKDFSEFTAPGWNSWDYYRWTITEDEVLENAEFIAHDPVLSKHVKKIIVDDGWQYCYGEWHANHLFPHGMEYLAKKIKKLGFKPGLWIAPTIIEPHSWIAQMETDMLGRGENGQPCLCWQCMRRYAFVLDPTTEKARKFIYDLFDRYAGYGYEYFKLDFLGSTNLARQFADKKAGRGHIMENTIGVARQAVQGRAQILGCNYNYNGGMAHVDMARVGGDIHARWDSIKENTASVAMRFWSNKKLWVNDPDFALCRSFDTANDPALTQMLCCMVYVDPDQTDPNFGPGTWKLVDMYKAQAEVLLSIALCAGGSINLSDKMTRLNEAGLDLARRTVSAESGDAAIPLDLFSEKLPCYWVQKVKDYHRVLLVNWEDTPAVRRIDLNRLGVSSRKCINFWNDKAVKTKNGIIEVELAPRSCLFVVAK